MAMSAEPGVGVQQRLDGAAGPVRYGDGKRDREKEADDQHQRARDPVERMPPRRTGTEALVYGVAVLGRDHIRLNGLHDEGGEQASAGEEGRRTEKETSSWRPPVRRQGDEEEHGSDHGRHIPERAAVVAVLPGEHSERPGWRLSDRGDHDDDGEELSADLNEAADNGGDQREVG